MVGDSIDITRTGVSVTLQNGLMSSKIFKNEQSQYLTKHFGKNSSR